MYQEFFTFKIKPFSISPDPNFLFLSGRHKEAISHLKNGLHGNTGFALLTGEVGTGKTTIYRSLIDAMGDDSDIASILNSALSDVELLASICDCLNIDHFASDLNELFEVLSNWIIANAERDRRTIVIIDEAQHLSFPALEQLRLLTNIKTNGKNILHVILIGQTELQDKLKQTEFRQLAQSITARYHLLSLTQEESNLYIQHRLRVAGSEHAVFDKSALEEIYNKCLGTPRLTNMLCDRSLLAAYAQDSHIVTLKMVKEASKEIHFTHQKLKKNGKNFNWRLMIIALLSLLVIWQTPKILQLLNPVDLLTTEAKHASLNIADLWADSSLDAQWFDAYPQLDLSKTLYGDALVSLYSVWGYEVNKNNLSCNNKENGAYISCYSSKITLQQLKQLNHPGVVRLQKESGSALYAVIYQIAGDYQLLIDGNLIPVSEQWFSNYWSGEVTLLWQAPFVLEDTIKFGQEGEQVTWLANQLNQLQGLARENKTYFDTRLLDQVSAFQRQHGLLDNGIVDQHTFMTLIQQISPNSPRLSQEKY